MLFLNTTMTRVLVGHHGPSPNPLMPDSWNTRTSLSKLKQGGPGSVAVVDPGDVPPQCYYYPPMLLSTLPLYQGGPGSVAVVDPGDTPPSPLPSPPQW